MEARQPEIKTIMKSFTNQKALWLSIVFALLCGSFGADAFAQGVSTQPTTKPLLQPINVRNGSPQASPTPLIQKTASVEPVIPVSPLRTTYANLSDVAVPGYSGILVETLDGKPVLENYSNYTFNPASNVKVATAFAVLKTFGPDYRFPTNVWTDGAIDRASGTLIGNLYISGRDPMFNYEHAITIANELNKMGVRSVQGDLIVTDNFSFNYNMNSQRAGVALQSTMNSSKRTAAATKSWLAYLSNSGKFNQIQGVPSITFTGGNYVQSMPSNVHLLFTHESTPLREIVKVTLCYSNNFLAERLGDMIGGASFVARTVQQYAGVTPAEFSLQTASGLGINRVTPRAQMKLLRVFRNELARYKMTFADVMPVAGMDKGTLEHRFDTDFAKGSVVGKTGTLGQTDSGVSSLTGEINTRNGKLLFVIFNQRGSVQRFRSFQNSFVSLVQGQFGGAASMNYAPVVPDVRLARTRVTYPASGGVYGN